LENNLPQKVADLSQGQTIKISFCESCCLIIELVPQDSKISCSLQEFGYSTKKLHFDLDKNQVLKTLVNFINQVMEKAVISGFITFMEKEQYMIPVLIKAMR
jgi:superfamily II DNA/RNA helicase